MTEDQLNELWVAANVHSINMIGEFLAEGAPDKITCVPPRPENAVELIIDYLKGTV